MANYVKATDFQAKDALITGDPSKIIKGSEINDEFNAIQTAVATKADLASPAFTGTPTAATQASGNSSTRLATTAFVDTAITIGLGTLGTIATQDANAVNLTGGSITGLTALTIPSAAIATTQAVGDSSLAVATTAFVNNEIANDIGNSFTGANQSLSSSGYQKLPGGLIMQWGTLPVLADDTNSSVTFPIAFTTACFSVNTTADTGNNGATTFFVTAISTTGFSIRHSTTVFGVSSGGYWFSVGK